MGRKICSNCVMDVTVGDIRFDDRGVCNYCHEAQARLASEIYHGEQGRLAIDRLVVSIKAASKGKKYDCIIGLSGGVDSTYLAYLVKRKLNLRPLAVHFDNGWNSELSVSNIERIVKILDIDYYNYVVDWDTFKNLQLAFLKASVANAEIPTDHAITALLMQQAAKHNVKYILLGGNVATESIMPNAWMYDNRDWKLIKAINKRFGQTKLKGYPHFSLTKMFYYVFIKRIRFVALLNYVSYIKEDAKKVLEQELGWRDYGGKHFESVYTRFFQAYILPRKFNIDKRRAHLSSLINANQMTRKEALKALEESPENYKEVTQDKKFLVKKFRLSEEEFEQIMSAPKRLCEDFPSHSWLFERSPQLLAFIKKLVMLRV